MDEAAYEHLLARLCEASVKKRYECYRDIDWDAPEMQLDPDDPLLELPPHHSLGQTQWYRSQPAGIRSRMGLQMSATFMYTGRVFEAVLSRGLLRFAMTRPHGSLEYRYAYHEVIEESHHSLMFQEFVNRSGMTVPVLDAGLLEHTDAIADLGSSFPELLFIYALGGEDPIDYVQREMIARGFERHPLTQRISQIHITEEARHTAFARAYLRLNVPKLSPERRRDLALGAPEILGKMAGRMLQAPHSIIEQYDVPPEVVDEAYTHNPDHHARVHSALSKVRALCEELGLLYPEARALWLDRQLIPAGN